jgi:hypothetical protein
VEEGKAKLKCHGCKGLKKEKRGLIKNKIDHMDETKPYIDFNHEIY